VAAFALPRIVIGGLAGNGGKTLVAAGLCRALRRRGLAVAPFKKGPDYIDPAWLGAAAGRPANTLDTFLMPQARILASLAGARGAGADVAVIEGNRGVFDGLDAEGTHSTAELAKRIRAPLVLVVDTTKSTRTVAALVLGCLALDPGLPLAGVILNRVGGSRQERVIREAITRATRVPVLGAIPRLPADHLPARHLGLVMPGERADREQVLDAMAEAIEQGVDVESIKFLADEAPCLPMPAADTAAVPVGEAVRIGVLMDDAFSFYYPENLAALEAQGATLVPISPLRDRELPAIDALYAGGGYPEEHAAALAANVPLKTALATKIAAGLPVWAECGGLMYLARGLVSKGQRHAMVGALPVEIEQTARPQGHGYVEACVDGKNPFFPLGTRLRGHEFHYSRLFDAKSAPPTALALAPGTGLGCGRDGIVQGRVFAGYLHVFAPGVPEWAKALVRLAREARARTVTTPEAGGDHRGIHNGSRHADRDRRGRIHPGACQVD
jgi:cobyrinic acid a,c-diamide synthase